MFPFQKRKPKSFPMSHIAEVLNKIDSYNFGVEWYPLEFKTKEEYAESLSGNEKDYALWWIRHQ